MKNLKIKVCGMKEQDEVDSLCESNLIDYIGFIFYSKSPRFIVDTPSTSNVKRVGVFVNEELETILKRIDTHQLDIVQLHGDESVEDVKSLKGMSNVQLVKVIGVDESTEFKDFREYEMYIDFYLFDTKSSKYGGTGRLFDWEVLKKYKGEVPFFLSGGLNEESIFNIETDLHPKLVGIDLNSGFELTPGKKDTRKIIETLKKLKSYGN